MMKDLEINLDLRHNIYGEYMKYLMLHPHPHPHIWNLTCTRPRQCQVLNNYIKVSRKCSLAPTWKRNCNPPIHEWTTYDQEVDAYTKQYTMSNPNLDQTHRMDKLIYIYSQTQARRRDLAYSNFYLITEPRLWPRSLVGPNIYEQQSANGHQRRDLPWSTCVCVTCV